MTRTPQEVTDVLGKLDASDRETIQSYIAELETKVFGEEEPASVPSDEPSKTADDSKGASDSSDEPPFPPTYSSGEDYDKAGDAKQQAADAKASADWETALEHYTTAVQAAPPSALLYANRAHALLKLGRPLAAERDANLALKENPDSAKALRMRGKARKALDQWEAALKDLSQAQAIDFDEGTVEDLKELTEKHLQHEMDQAAERNLQEEKKRKRAEEIRKAQEQAKQESASNSSGGMPGGTPGGMPSGMPGMPPGMDMAGMMGALMSDPELVAAMQNPKVQAALQEMMSGGAPNPAKMAQYMADPDVGPIFGKLMEKFGGMGGMGGAAPPPGGEDDDIPNLDEMNGDVDLDDLPDLE